MRLKPMPKSKRSEHVISGPIDYRHRVTVPIRDMHHDLMPVVFLVDVYGVRWQDLTVVPGGSAPMMKAVLRMGLDPGRYPAYLFDLGPHCERPPL
jgi:hypothetical protein